jgi:hypothetical protein
LPHHATSAAVQIRIEGVLARFDQGDVLSLDLDVIVVGRRQPGQQRAPREVGGPAPGRKSEQRQPDQHSRQEEEKGALPTTAAQAQLTDPLSAEASGEFKQARWGVAEGPLWNLYG